MSLIKEINVWVGIDWADRKHSFALRKRDGQSQSGYFAHSAVSIATWGETLKKLAGNGKVAIALEQSKGGLIFALMKYDFIVLYPINPNTFARYREAWSPSGAKDDPTDALLILDLLEHHCTKLQPWSPEPKEVRLLQRLTEQRVRLVNQLKKVGNRLTSTLKEYFPEVLEIFPRIYRDIVADFLLSFPNLEAAQKASEQELVNFFRSHTAGNSKLTLKRIAILKNALPLTEDQAIISSNSLFVRGLARELKALNASILEYNEQIETVYRDLPDSKLFDSLPSAGDISAPRLLAAIGIDRTKFNSAEELACFAGIAPVIERSGNQCWTRWRYKCNKTVRQSFIEWTFLSMRTSFWAENFYKKQRQKGKSHSVAVRALAYKWTRIIFRLWKDKTPYSEARYLKALHAARSPNLVALSA